MKYFFDTEFIEDGKTIDLISIGIVAENGESFYMETDFDESKANDWVVEHVFPSLGLKEDRRPLALIRDSLIAWIEDTPQFVAYYAAYDWVALCQLFGAMIDLPQGWPMFCLDLKQLMHHTNQHSEMPPELNNHNALEDAQWCKETWENLVNEIRT